MALVTAAIPHMAFASGPDDAWRTRFLSLAGTELPDDYRINGGDLTFFVVHGAWGKATLDSYRRQADAIGQRFPEANVVMVDWRAPAVPRLKYQLLGMPCMDIIWVAVSSCWTLSSEYRQAVKNAPCVGREIAQWMKQKGVMPSRTVICGHSLGGQIAAFAGNECTKRELFGEPLWAILATDPAGPFFEGKPPEKRLDKQDARQVIVVHTTRLFGDEGTIGTVDIDVSWPEPAEGEQPDYIWRHSQAKELVTDSFLQPEMSNSDGTPFGANALWFDFADSQRRTFAFRPKEEPQADLALASGPEKPAHGISGPGLK